MQMMPHSRFPLFRALALREAGPPKSHADSIGAIADLITQATPGETVPMVADVPAGIGDEALGMQIDADLAPSIWSGTSFADRTADATANFSRDLVNEIEVSLKAQESYEDFEARFLRSMGLEQEAPSGPLRDLENRILNETRIAWNRGMISAQEAEGTGDTDLVWRSRLLPTTTPGCGGRHGRLVASELAGELPPRHNGCYCDAIVIPNPNSDSPDVAEAGQGILDEMQGEREAWGASDDDLMEESDRVLSRFARFREMGSDAIGEQGMRRQKAEPVTEPIGARTIVPEAHSRETVTAGLNPGATYLRESRFTRFRRITAEGGEYAT